MAVLFLGVDWGEHHHDLCLLDQDGNVLTARRVLVAAHAQDPAEVAVGIETDRGLLVGALLAVGYQVYAVNPAYGEPLPRSAWQLAGQV